MQSGLSLKSKSDRSRLHQSYWPCSLDKVSDRFQNCLDSIPEVGSDRLTEMGFW